MLLEISNPLDYKVALYIRLSKEDDNEQAKSESKINQRSMLSDFVEKRKLDVYDVYIVMVTVVQQLAVRLSIV